MIPIVSVLQWLTDNNYVTSSKETGYVLNKKFQDDVKRARRGLPSMSVVPREEKGDELSVVPQAVLSVEKFEIDWPVMFMELIRDAAVPARLEDNHGGEYDANKYSEEGMKAFKAAILTGADYRMLVRSVMLYYKSSLRYKKKIGNYFTQGDWRTDYLALSQAVEGGKEQLADHIKQETDSNEHNPYRIG